MTIAKWQTTKASCQNRSTSNLSYLSTNVPHIFLEWAFLLGLRLSECLFWILMSLQNILNCINNSIPSLLDPEVIRWVKKKTHRIHSGAEVVDFDLKPNCTKFWVFKRDNFCKNIGFRYFLFSPSTSRWCKTSVTELKKYNLSFCTFLEY